ERRVGRQPGNYVRHRLIGKDSISPAHQGFAVSERVPGEADARLEVLVALIVDRVETRSEAHKRTRALIECHETVVALGRRHKPLVAESKLQGQSSVQLVVVLSEEAERASPDTRRYIADRDGKGVGVSVQEVSRVGEAEGAGGLVGIVVVETAELAAEFERMSATQIVQ